MPHGCRCTVLLPAGWAVWLSSGTLKALGSEGMHDLPGSDVLEMLNGI